MKNTNYQDPITIAFFLYFEQNSFDVNDEETFFQKNYIQNHFWYHYDEATYE